MDARGTDWLASGGAYLVLFVQTGLVMGLMIYLAFRAGRVADAEGDGCLLAIANVVLTLLGAAVGFFAAPYPMYLVTSGLGALALPWLATWWLSRRMRAR